MRCALPTVVLILFASLFLAPVAADDKKETAKDLIIGKWQPADPKEMVILEFTKDGKIIVKETRAGKTSEITGTYKFVGADQVQAVMRFNGEEKKENLTVTVTRDELTTTDSGKKTDKFKRVK
jgi:uncharacterized protein (TIGR03066 family)